MCVLCVVLHQKCSLFLIHKRRMLRVSLYLLQAQTKTFNARIKARCTLIPILDQAIPTTCCHLATLFWMPFHAYAYPIVCFELFQHPATFPLPIPHTSLGVPAY